MAAPKGNHNAKKGKLWREALDKALKRYETAGTERGQALYRIAERVVEGALAGDKDCWQEIANRLDGKPAQMVTHAGDDDAPPIKAQVIFVRPS